jgi:ABC-2 type transport system ATP-binding protein
MSSQAPAIDVSGLFFHYGQQAALNGLDLRVSQSVIFALLGPNGSGKSTLFRILSTVEPCQQGEVRIHDCDLRSQPNRVRQLMGVVFQSPSLDRKLTVRENLACQGVLYGLSGAGLENASKKPPISWALDRGWPIASRPCQAVCSDAWNWRKACSIGHDCS